MTTKKILLLVQVIFLLISSCRESERYSVLIVNGQLYDGAGGPPQRLDIAIANDRIVIVGNISGAKADRVIDAQGLAVCPGFIDLHAHLESIKEYPDCENLVRQGVTTALGGPDGGGPWPFRIWLDSLTDMGIGINAGFLVGHNVIRQNILKLENRKPTRAELDRMKEQVSTAMEQGAFGLSTGLKYLPGTFATTDEIIELSEIAARYGGIYTSHLRDEGLGLLQSVNEALKIGSKANIPVVLTHHKVVGKPMWGASVKTLALVDSARAAGLDIMLDQYPYTASRTSISILIPSWALEGGRAQFIDRLDDTALRDRIKREIVDNLNNDRGGGDLRNVQLSKVTWNRQLDNKTLYDWCVMEKLAPTPANGAELVIRAHVNGDTRCIFHAMDASDVIRILKHPYTAIASDGILTKPGAGHVHPRAYGTFPRVLSKYVREEHVISLEEALRKMTTLPASRLGFTDRGSIKKNAYADIVIFDPETIADKGTFADPEQYPEGIKYVLINGKIALDNGVFQSTRSGRILLRPGTK